MATYRDHETAAGSLPMIGASGFDAETALAGAHVRDRFISGDAVVSRAHLLISQLDSETFLWLASASSLDLRAAVDFLDRHHVPCSAVRRYRDIDDVQG